MSQSLIFDMDGTLFQTDKILELSLDDTFNHLRSLNKWDSVTPIDKYREIMGDLYQRYGRHCYLIIRLRKENKSMLIF
jgi:FMN phosphatase YigB (HAD superfamily)